MQMIRKYIKKFRFIILALILRLKCFRVKNAIIVFSNPRGGSTWLMEIFNTLPYSVINMEPLHNDFGVVPKRINLGHYPYLPVDYSDSKVEKLFLNIISFRIFNKWSTNKISFKKLVSAKIVITKFILANQLLPWFVVKFAHKLNYKPVCLFRHPITTCISQLKTFHKMDTENFFKSLNSSEKFLIPNSLFAERFNEHLTFINALESKMEQQIAVWCINNANLFNHTCSDKWITVFYEDIVKSPLSETANLFNTMGVDYDYNKLAQYDFIKPSKSNFFKQYNSNSETQLEGYLNQFSKEQLQRIQTIFDHFNFRIYSAFNAYPIIKKG